ncbi:hypothetical protein MLD38_035590 [Melastoma candidum]|nr:hypothetical protein MLD38_035590 [Melastoma candidum]
MKDEIHAGTRTSPWSLTDDMVTFDGRLYIPPASPLLQEIMVAVHENGHEGVQRTVHRLRRDFHFPNMRRLVQDFIRACTTCQRYKSEHLHPAGLLMPLPVPKAVWTDIGLDFVEALPRVGGKSVILTVVDRFSKYCHFIPLAHPYTAESVAQAFFTDIVRLHGVPQSMVSDRDPVFTSMFWQELMRLMGAKLHMTTVFHPQSDGQSEAANRVIVMYLRCFTGDRPRQWLRWLPWAAYVYNTAYQTSLRDTPFRVVYGRDPPTFRSYEPGETRVVAVAKTMAERDEFLADVRYRLDQAQTVQKLHYDKLHRPVSYQVGDWVLLRLRHRAAASLPQATTGKLKPRYFGPYRITALINDVAVRLQLPPRARLHDVLHVGLLKKFVGQPPDAPPPLPAIHHGAVTPVPERAVRTRFARGIHQVLIHWKGESAASATWEDVDVFLDKYPAFQLEDELLVEGGRDVIWEHREITSRDGHMKLKAKVFFASIDQRSEQADGESACTALSYHRRSLEWRKLCENGTYRERFLDKHFDLDTVLEAQRRPLTVIPGKSFIGFFHPDGMDDGGFDILQGAVSFDNIWDEICRIGSECGCEDEPHLYIVSWNDHFFILKVEKDAYYIVDTLGERLFEGCNQAYILKFDENTTISKVLDVKPSSDEKATVEVKSLQREQEAPKEENTASTGGILVPQPNNTNGDIPEAEEEVVSRGKDSCKEYIKNFLAAIPLRELLADIKKGLMVSTPLHHQLQIEFHCTRLSPQFLALTLFSDTATTAETNLVS